VSDKSKMLILKEQMFQGRSYDCKVVMYKLDQDKARIYCETQPTNGAMPMTLFFTSMEKAEDGFDLLTSIVKRTLSYQENKHTKE
jgi:hypothetical protein